MTNLKNQLHLTNELPWHVESIQIHSLDSREIRMLIKQAGAELGQAQPLLGLESKI